MFSMLFLFGVTKSEVVIFEGLICKFLLKNTVVCDRILLNIVIFVVTQGGILL